MKRLNAYAPALRLTLATHAVGAGTNETAQLPEFIESLDIQRATIFIDAAGTHGKVAAAIDGQKADYVLTVKDNQPALMARIECFFQGG